MKLTKGQQAKLKQIGDEHNLDFIVLHGSRVTGKTISPESDIDVAIYRRGGVEFNELISLNSEFMQVFKGEDVDVKTLNRKDALFRFEVMRDAQVLYGDPQVVGDYYIYTYKDYNYKKPLYKTMVKMQNKRQRLFNRRYA